jgi:hypothetical protein
MREIVIRYLPKFLDQELYKVFVPINGTLTPFNFFEKQAAMLFANTIIDGEFTDEELRVVMLSPVLPAKERKKRGRPEVVPLSERPISSLGEWDAKRRRVLTFEVLKDNEDRWTSSHEVWSAAKEKGDTVSHAAYHSLLRSLHKKDIVEVQGERPYRYRLKPDVAFEHLTPIPTPKPTHKVERLKKRIRKEKDQETQI